MDQELSTFLSAQGLSATSGDIVSACGKRLGCHQGIWRYTIGQRRGLGLPDSSPWYVAAIDSKKNQLIVAKQGSQGRLSSPGGALSSSVPSTGLQTLRLR